MPANSALLKSPSQRQGGVYEQMAEEFLKAQGLLVLEKNWQEPKIGEIDLILIEPGRFWDILVFAEVRKRKVIGYGDAVMSVTRSKQQKLIKVARYFLQQHPKYVELECRFDVIAFNQFTSKSLDQSFSNVSHQHNNGLPQLQCEPEWIKGAFVASAW